MAKKTKSKKKVKKETKSKKKTQKSKKKVKTKNVKEEVKKVQERLSKAVEAETEKELRQKCKDLAKIIEEMSLASEEIPVTKVEDVLQPKIKEMSEVFDQQLKDMKDSLQALEKKMEKPTKLKGKVSGAVSQIEQNIEPRVSQLEDQIKALDKLSELEKQLKEVVGEDKDGKKFPKLSLLENKVIKTMQEDLLEVKEAVVNLNHSFKVMREKTQKRMQKIQESLTPETLQKLNELIAFLDKAIPSKVKEEVGDKFDSVFTRLKDLEKNASDLEKRMDKTLKEVNKNEQKIEIIKDIKANIAKLYVEKDNLYKISENIRSEASRGDNELRFEFQDKIDQVLKKFDEFDVILDNYLKKAEKNFTISVADFSKKQLSDLEKRYVKRLEPIKEEIKDLQIDLSKFQNLVNSTFDSIRDSLDKLNLQTQKIKEFDKEEHKRIQLKLMEQVEKFVDDPKNYTKAIEGSVDKFFKKLAETKLAEVQEGYSSEITSIRTGLDNIDTRVSNFEKFVESTFDVIKKGMEEYDVKLQKLREDEVRELQKLEKRIESNKEEFNSQLQKLSETEAKDILRIEKDIKDQKSHIESTLKSYPKVIEENVQKMFSSLSESKIAEMQKKHHIDLISVSTNVGELEKKISGFEGTVNSTFESIDDTLENLKDQLEKTREKEEAERLKFGKKLVKDIEKFMDNPKNYSKAIEGSIDSFFSKLAEPKLLEMKKSLDEDII
jgi:DNA repair exonuclease SbcCD ATPase subunit